MTEAHLIPPAFRTLPRIRLFLVFIAPLVAVGLVAGLAYAIFSHTSFHQHAEAATVQEPVGSAIFLSQCARCHGPKGQGDGMNAIDPPARAFGKDKFRYTRMTHPLFPMPTDDDLLRCLERGLPGSAMPAFPELTKEERLAVLAHVRNLTRYGLYSSLWKNAEKSAADGGDDPEPAKISAKVEELTRDSRPVPIPEVFTEPSNESIAAGRRIFLSDSASCAKCHGPEGRGDGPQVTDAAFKNENGTRAFPRDLTLGLFKGGDDPKSIFVRIRTGIPGTPMPQNPSLTDGEVMHLVNYVLSLSAQSSSSIP